MKYRLERANNFRRSFKRIKFTSDEEMSYIDVIYKLLNGITLDYKYKDHQLKGSLKEYRECHIKPDLLLVYKVEENVLILADIGSHSELFK
jgi:mRNA interferase YafQ